MCWFGTSVVDTKRLMVLPQCPPGGLLFGLHLGSSLGNPQFLANQARWGAGPVEVQKFEFQHARGYGDHWL